MRPAEAVDVRGIGLSINRTDHCPPHSKIRASLISRDLSLVSVYNLREMDVSSEDNYVIRV